LERGKGGRMRTWLSGVAFVFLAGAAAAQAPAVTVVTVQPTDVTPEARFTGRIEAIDHVELRARVEGFLEERPFRDGRQVRAGDLLFRIERAPYEANLAEIEATIASNQAALRLAELDFQRKRELLARQAAPQAQVDEAEATRAQAEAAVMRAEAARQRARLDLDYTEIRSPLAGKIGRAAVSVGDFVSSGSGVLATIVSEDPMYVTFPVTQRELLAVKRRTLEAGLDPSDVEVRVRLADGAVYEHVGEVDFVDVQVDPGTDTVQVRATLANPDGLLVDGQLVTAIVQTGSPQQALLIPQRAMQVDQSGRFVLAVDDESKVRVKRIDVGATVGANVVVTSGLDAGDRVVVEGLQRVRPDQEVDAAEQPGA
jgi:membrane fusion protein (multidrug efflux system)